MMLTLQLNDDQAAVARANDQAGLRGVAGLPVQR